MFPLFQHAHYRHEVIQFSPLDATCLQSVSFPFVFLFSLQLFCFVFLGSFRTSDGKLHLLPEIGKIPFVDATLIEDPTETSSCDDDDGIIIIIDNKTCFIIK